MLHIYWTNASEFPRTLYIVICPDFRGYTSILRNSVLGLYEESSDSEKLEVLYELRMMLYLVLYKANLHTHQTAKG